MRRWLIVIWLGAAGCGSLPASASSWFLDPRWREASALIAERARAARHLALYRILDSLPAQLARVPAGASSVVLGLDSVSDPDRRSLEAKVAQVWSRARGGDLRLAVVLYGPDSAESTTPRARFEGSILPERIDGRTCVSVVARRSNWKGQLAELGSGQLEGLIAPCVFRARFGPPGLGMQRWLAGTDYEAIQSADWLYRPARSSVRFESWYRPEGGEWFVPLRLAFSQLVTPYWSGPSAVGCLAGRNQDCERVVLDPVRDARGVPIVAVAGVVPSEEWSYLRVVGRAAWVDHLIRTGGEAAFQRLWRGDADLAAGFRVVYGQDLGDAVAEWERIDWQRNSDAPPVRLGATIERGAAAASLGWGVLILLLPLIAARRRSLP